MKNKKLEGVILVVIGLIIICVGLYVYFIAYKIYLNSDSNRVQDLNWLLRKFGRTGTAILISIVGVIPLYIGIRKLK